MPTNTTNGKTIYTAPPEAQRMPQGRARDEAVRAMTVATEAAADATKARTAATSVTRLRTDATAMVANIGVLTSEARPDRVAAATLIANNAEAAATVAENDCNLEADDAEGFAVDAGTAADAAVAAAVVNNEAEAIVQANTAAARATDAKDSYERAATIAIDNRDALKQFSATINIARQVFNPNARGSTRLPGVNPIPPEAPRVPISSAFQSEKDPWDP